MHYKHILSAVASIGLISVSTAVLAEDFDILPLSTSTVAPLELGDIVVGFEHQLNPCTFIDPVEGFICVPTDNGGFVILPESTSPILQDPEFGGGYWPPEGPIDWLPYPRLPIELVPDGWDGARVRPNTIPESAFIQPMIAPVTNVEGESSGKDERMITDSGGLRCLISEARFFNYPGGRTEITCM